MTEDEIVGCHNQLNEHEFEQTLGDSKGQRSRGMLQFMGFSRQEYWSGLTLPSPIPFLYFILLIRYITTHTIQITLTYLKHLELNILKNHLLLTFSSVQFSRSVVSDSLQPHESQHVKPPCTSPTPRVHLHSRPSSQ